MSKLSLPGPIPSLIVPPGKKKQRCIELEMEVELDPTTEDYLESYMDKLLTWQLVSPLNRFKERQTGNPKFKMDNRDWMQIFTEDIVKHQYMP